jgi:hypothetical protein
MKLITIFLFLLLLVEFPFERADNQKYFLSREPLSSLFLVFFENGEGELYSCGGSFYTKFNFKWTKNDNMYMIVYKDDNYQSDRLEFIGGRKLLQVLESESSTIEKVQILSNHRKFKEVNRSKFLRKYKIFLEKFQEFGLPS